MRMVLQGLAPRVQHGDRADLGAEVTGVGGDLAQGVRRSPKQDGVGSCPDPWCSDGVAEQD
jgi:hypothetical protein